MRCAKCDSENREGRKFCANCGTSMTVLCPKCGTANESSEKFCGECGVALAPLAEATPPDETRHAGERRHLTILFCDLVGSTTMAARLDPEEWRATVAGYQRVAAEAITRFGGEVVRYVGDGIMAFFGYPAAHDNDAERAARAGLAILNAIAQLNQQPAQPQLAVRIGIDSGLVVVGAGTGQAVDAFGDTANIAARVQAAAEAGTLLISEATQRLVPGLFIVADRGVQELKGIALPVQLYRVVRPSGMHGRFEAMTAAGGLTRFVGREDELRSLQSRWERMLEGEGQVALIIGEAGIGKSRLMQRFHEQIGGTPHTWIEAEAGALYQNTPFYPIGEMLRQFVGDTPVEGQIAVLAARLTAAGLAPAEAIPLLAPLLNVPLPPEYTASLMSPEQQRRRLLATLVEWVLGSAHTQPLVIAIEDLHWVDPSTLELIQLLVEQGATARLLLLYTARPEFRPPWTMRAHHTQITLNRLSVRDARTIVAEVAAQKALSDETIATMVERTGGVPLFVEELTRAVLESGDAKLTGSAIPATLHDSLMARLDRLGSAKEVIQIGAVIGSDFSYELLHAVHPIAEPNLQSALRSLTDAELLYVRGIAPEATYQFKHALIRDAAYEALLKSRRKELHMAVARTIDEQFPALKETHPEVLARQWTEAGAIELAIGEWQKAAARATGRGALPEAAGHYGTALSLLGSLPKETERERLELPLQIGLGLALFGAKGFSHAETYKSLTRAQALAERLGKTHLILETLFGLAGSVFAQAHVIESHQLAERELRLAEECKDQGFICAGNFQIGQALLMLGKFAEAQAHVDLALANSNQTDGRQVTSDSRNHARATAAGLAMFLGFPDRSRLLLGEALQAAQTDGNYYHLAFTQMWAGFCLLNLRDERGLIEQAKPLRQIADEAPFFLGHADFFGGWGLLILGQADEGIDQLRRATALWEKVGYRLQHPWELQAEAEFCAMQGRLNDGLALIDQALIESGEDLPFYRSRLLTARANLLVRQDAAAESVEQVYREAVDVAREQSARMFELEATVHFARWLKTQDRCDEARTMLAQIYNWFTEGFDTADLKEAKALLEELGS